MVGIGVNLVHVRHLHHGQQRKQDQTHHGDSRAKLHALRGDSRSERV